MYAILAIFFGTILSAHCLPMLSSRRIQHAVRKSHLYLIDNNSIEEWSKSVNENVPIAFEPPGSPPLEIWIGSIVALVPIIWATIEFTSRIRVQQQCLVCQGSGLVYITKSGNPLTRARKCFNCGGFLPWLGWRRFFLSTFDVGNGGVLQFPSRDYAQNNAAAKSASEAGDEVMDTTTAEGPPDR